mgnify:CR=1 FL=1
MKKFSTYLLVMFMAVFSIIRIIVTIMSQLGKDFMGMVPMNEAFEIGILFATLVCMILIVKRKLTGAIIYLVLHSIYFGGDITNKLSKELAPNESNTVTLHTSKLLTSTDDNTFNNKAEITEVTKKPGFNTGTPTKVVWNVDKFNFNIDNAEEVIIIPSTGEDKNYALPIIIGISSLILLGVGAFGIKKFVIDNK